jgi:cyclopropane fatty-acyl-phospholipid synthase-like methyltransferase
MDLQNIIRRTQNPTPWSEDEKIPWHDPDFSHRMLDEHLTQDHDAASRRSERIEMHVSWIHNSLLGSKQSKILDLGCGPGLYSNRLASMGHQCVGIDFSPASIRYARERASARNLSSEFIQEDIRTADYGDDYQLVMLLYGEFNVFRHEEIRDMLNRAYHSLARGGTLLLGPHTFEAVREMGHQTPTWDSSLYGLFSEQPHLSLKETFWDENAYAAMQRYYVIDASTSEVSRYGQTINAYDDDGYRKILTDTGFEDVTFSQSMGEDEGTEELMVITAIKPD